MAAFGWYPVLLLDVLQFLEYQNKEQAGCIGYVPFHFCKPTTHRCFFYCHAYAGATAGFECACYLPGSGAVCFNDYSYRGVLEALAKGSFLWLVPYYRFISCTSYSQFLSPPVCCATLADVFG